MQPSPQKCIGRASQRAGVVDHHPSSSDESDRAQCSAKATSCTSSDNCNRDRHTRSRQSKTYKATGLGMRQLNYIAKDVEHFDPDSREANVNDYLWEIEHCLADLPNALPREMLKRIWKTTSRSVHAFIETQPTCIRDSYLRLCRVLQYSTYMEETSATLSAFQIKHRRTETPREYYRRMLTSREAMHKALKDNGGFKSLFLYNLHPCVRTHVTLMCKHGRPTMQEVRKMAQMTLETVVRTTDNHEDEVRVLNIQSSEGAELWLEGGKVPLHRVSGKMAPPERLPHQQQGGWKNWRQQRSTSGSE